MQNARIAIVGAGLSGLYAAFLLERSGIRDYMLIEARDAAGGRIASFSEQGNPSLSSSAVEPADRFDLGPTWFWPDAQPELDRLVRDLGLQRFDQFEAGDMLVERSPAEPAMRVRGYASSPVSTRLIGGMSALVDALRGHVSEERIVLGHAVHRLRVAGPRIELATVDASGRAGRWDAERVLLAVPPRLAEAAIEFSPPLPPALAQQWRATPTWMAPHAKYVAVYQTAFWRKQGLSGAARSAHGPLGEIHDASMPGGRAALFGFFGLPAHIRQAVPEHVLRTHCRAQLARLFGPQAATPLADGIKDWASDPNTATGADANGGGQHVEAPAAGADSGPWRGRLGGIASEWSRPFPGYLAGAIDAAGAGVRALSSTDAATSDAAAQPTSLEPQQ